VAYGARVGEVDFPIIGPIKQSVKFGPLEDVQDRLKRPPVAVSLGCHTDGHADWHLDPHDPYTMAAGVCKRVASAPPQIDRKLLARFRLFVRSFVRKHFTPLACTSDTSLDTWLSNTSYPEWRKRELREAFAKWRGNLDPKDLKVKSFMKDETYGEVKHARGIYSRSDLFKCLVGPTFKLIEAEVYSHESFIKHIPVKDRPEYITNLLQKVGAKYLQTDFTAFEAMFVREIMESCEFELYDYMTQLLPDHDDFMFLCTEFIAGINQCVFKNFSVDIQASRMSGEMCTSLGNGFTNLMLLLFACECYDSKAAAVVEGDDGLTSIVGRVPNSEFFARLGANVKLVVYDELNRASFCGLIFDPVDRCNLRDPFKVLINFGWAASRYTHSRPKKLRVLLRCKSLCLIYQYPGCPIIQNLALYGLRVTSDVRFYQLLKLANARGVEDYTRQLILSAISLPPYPRYQGMGSRLLFEQEFGVSIEQQREYERYLDSLKTITPLSPGVLSDGFSSTSQKYWNMYVLPLLDDFTHPPIPNRSIWRWEPVCVHTGW
jgi:hypothetical protein